MPPVRESCFSTVSAVSGRVRAVSGTGPEAVTVCPSSSWTATCTGSPGRIMA